MSIRRLEIVLWRQLRLKYYFYRENELLYGVALTGYLLFSSFRKILRLKFTCRLKGLLTKFDLKWDEINLVTKLEESFKKKIANFNSHSQLYCNFLISLFFLCNSFLSSYFVYFLCFSFILVFNFPHFHFVVFFLIFLLSVYIFWTLFSFFPMLIL